MNKRKPNLNLIRWKDIFKRYLDVQNQCIGNELINVEIISIFVVHAKHFFTTLAVQRENLKNAKV